ncbi:hypothetical protein CCR75_004110 [Bremia lactucae]|uniref:Uncharacterized protein n=1 Tax=Bremia lactucae TaxID=4779 RepID=A0A976FKJ1_BRELC|nr:hypothetical protein CCR75_004110 [Bremia lactucae]
MVRIFLHKTFKKQNLTKLLPMTGLEHRVVQVLQFANARAPELQALHDLSQHNELYSVTDDKLEQQKNQRRRRANAFKSHKMPQRLRGTPAKNTNIKRCRKHERRPHKLLQEHLNVADSERLRWLPTHLWHAKRMVVQEQYGYMLALHRSDKSVSAALEAVRKMATLHDSSYNGIIELFGLPQIILEALQLISDSNGSDFNGLRFLAGAEEGTSVLYRKSEFPQGAITPVKFMWRPLKEDYKTGKFQLHEDWQNTKRQLWLWVHPAAYMEAATAIAAACQEVVGEGDEHIEMHDRRGHLCRFKVRGRVANELVANLLAGGDLEISEDDEEEVLSDHEDGYSTKDIVANCNIANRRKFLEALCKTCTSKEADEHNNVIYSVVVKDPRLARFRNGKMEHVPMYLESDFSLLKEPPAGTVPEVGTSVVKSPSSGLSISSLGKDADEPDTNLVLQEIQSLLAWTTESSKTSAKASYPIVNENYNRSEVQVRDGDNVNKEASPCSMLWSLSKRQKVESIFVKDHTLNKEIYCQRKNSGGVGSGLVNLPLLHMMAIKKREPYPHTSGWDLIVSPSHAPSLLKALVFSGALVVGLEEDSALSTVLHQPSFPCDYPDTKAGQLYWETRARNLEREQAKKPKSKRFNFEKHGVKSPYKPLWKLIFATDDNVPLPCVLRGKKYMEAFCFCPSKSINTEAMTSAVSDTRPIVSVPMPTLVRVSVIVPRRGNISVNAMLFAPSAEDVKQYFENWKGGDIVAAKSDNSKSNEVSKYPNNLLFALVCCQRSLIGFVTSAIYDRPKGAVRAVGFIACEPLQQLFFASQGLMLRKKGHYALAVLRSPQSGTIRPVLVQADV